MPSAVQSTEDETVNKTSLLERHTVDREGNDRPRVGTRAASAEGLGWHLSREAPQDAHGATTGSSTGDAVSGLSCNPGSVARLCWYGGLAENKSGAPEELSACNYTPGNGEKGNRWAENAVRQ